MANFGRREILRHGIGIGLLAAGAGGIIASRMRPAYAAGTFDKLKSTKSVTIGIANEKPYGYVETDGKITGAIVEVIRVALAPYGVTDLQSVVTNFDTLIPGLNAGRFDIIGAGMYVKPKRCEAIAFTNPLTQAGGAFGAKKGNPKNLHSLKDVAKDPTAKIGTQTGTSQVDEIKQAGINPDQVVLFSKDTESIAGLQAGRVDVIYYPDLEINNLITTTADPNLERVSPYEQIMDAHGKPSLNYQSLGLRKDDADLVDAINKQLVDMHTNGKLLSTLAPFGFTQNEIPSVDVTAAQLCAG